MEKLKDLYAKALLELLQGQETLESNLEYGILAHNALNHPDVQAFLEHPHIPVSEKRKMIDEAFSGKIPDHLKGFMDLMINKKSESLILPVLSEYIDSINRSMGKIEATVVSAKALTELQIEAIRKVLSRKMAMQVEIIVKVDPDVIGGFYVLIDGKVFDGTVRTELSSIKVHLKKGSNE